MRLFIISSTSLAGLSTRTELQQVETDLEEKTRELTLLRKELARVEKEREQLSAQAKDYNTQNTQLLAKLREKVWYTTVFLCIFNLTPVQDRDLLAVRTELEKSQSKIENSERRTKELEEQIQNDDRVETLEAKVKNSQDRAEEVSFQLSKMKQVWFTCYLLVRS